MNEVIGVIPAAGKGSRLNELGQEVPKSLLKLNGKPLIQRAIENLIKLGVKKIIIIVNYKKELIQNFLKDHKFDAELIFVEQTELNGNVGGLILSEKYLINTFIQYHPDNIFTDSQEEILKKHLNDKPIATYLYEERESAPNSKLSFLVEDNRLLGMSKSNKGLKSPVGFSIHEPIFLDYCKLIKKSDSGEYLSKDVISLILSSGGKINAYKLNGQRIDITTKEDYYNALNQLDGEPL